MGREEEGELKQKGWLAFRYCMRGGFLVVEDVVYVQSTVYLDGGAIHVH